MWVILESVSFHCFSVDCMSCFPMERCLNWILMYLWKLWILSSFPWIVPSSVLESNYLLRPGLWILTVVGHHTCTSAASGPSPSHMADGFLPVESSHLSSVEMPLYPPSPSSAGSPWRPDGVVCTLEGVGLAFRYRHVDIKLIRELFPAFEFNSSPVSAYSTFSFQACRNILNIFLCIF